MTSSGRIVNNQPRRPPFRLARLVYKFYRGIVRVLSIPVRPLPEGPFKARVRSNLLRFQHSLPTELVVNKGDTAVQIGTPNVETMRRFRRAVGNDGRLLIVEAMPENQARLRAAIDRAGWVNVTVIAAAACNENRLGELSVSPVRGDHKIPLEGVAMDNDRRPENAQTQLIPVQFVRLDDALPDHGVTNIDYLSVTVNGAELEVLRGAETLLRNAHRHARVYAKGHAIDASGAPMNVKTQAFMTGLGYATTITKGEPSSIVDSQWRWRAGDVFAWRA